MYENLASYDIYFRLYLRIVSMEYLPGFPLDVKKLCKSFQLSRSPVRDALCVLDNGDLVVMEPQQGTQVSLISDIDLVDDTEIFRLFIEKAMRAFRSYGRVTEGAVTHLERSASAIRGRRFNLAVQEMLAFCSDLVCTCLPPRQVVRYSTVWGNVVRIISANIMLERKEAELLSFCHSALPLLEVGNLEKLAASFLELVPGAMSVEALKLKFPEFFWGFGQKT